MKQSGVTKLHKCANTIINLLSKELKDISSLKQRKEIINQLEKVTSLILKLNKVKDDKQVDISSITQKDEQIISSLLERYKK